MVWIKASDCLPDDDLEVLIFVPDDDEPVWIGYHGGDEWYSVDAMPLGQLVTHWMDLPEPPKLSALLQRMAG